MEKKYLDSWSNPEENRRLRSESARQHLQMLQRPNVIQSPPHKILEIGSGVGGVTTALRELYPSTELVAVDRDENARQIAQELDIPFEAVDLLTIDEEKARELIAGIDSIVALRTSGAVVLRMLDLLSKLQYSGTFTFSLIQQTDHKDIQKIDDLASHSSGNFQFVRFFARPYTFLENDRAKTERGYVVEFQSAQMRT